MVDKQDGKQPFFGIFTYTLPHAELVQPEDSILEGYQKKFFHDKTWGGSEGSRYNASVHTHAQFAGMITRLDHYVGEVLKKLKEKGIRSFAAHLKGENSYDQESYKGGTAFFIGNEGKGLTDQAAEAADCLIRIPMCGKVESLNAAMASGILMYEAARQRRE